MLHETDITCFKS